jgi:hypothetical protein
MHMHTTRSRWRSQCGARRYTPVCFNFGGSTLSNSQQGSTLGQQCKKSTTATAVALYSAHPHNKSERPISSMHLGCGRDLPARLVAVSKQPRQTVQCVCAFSGVCLCVAYMETAHACRIGSSERYMLTAAAVVASAAAATAAMPHCSRRNSCCTCMCATPHARCCSRARPSSTRSAQLQQHTPAA